MKKLKDDLTNAWLVARSYLRCVVQAKPNGNLPISVDQYELKFQDSFGGSSIDLSKWDIGQRWGEYHPEHPYQYYGKGEDFVSVESGNLNLYTRYQPKDFIDRKSSGTIKINYGIGLVISKESFSHGYYEVEAMLPEGILLWPAIWLTAVKTWPPEIDILESYSGREANYMNEKGVVNGKNQPNVHYGFSEDKTKSSYGAFSYPLPHRPTKRFVKYGLNWEKDFIRIYYDGYLVFQCTQGAILGYFNDPGVSMSIILNNGTTDQITDMITKSSVFKISSVKYFAKK